MARRIGMRTAVFGCRVICRRVKVVLGGRSIAVFLEPMDEALFGRPVDGLVVEGVGEIDNFCSVDFHRTIRFGAARLRMPAVKSKCFGSGKDPGSLGFARDGTKKCSGSTWSPADHLSGHCGGGLAARIGTAHEYAGFRVDLHGEHVTP